MDQELQRPEPKISDVEIILVGLFFGLLDLIDIIPIAGDITDIIAAPMGFYYWSKGINATAFIAAEILDLIPIAQEIPSRTIGWGITVVLDRSPKLQAKFATAIEVAGALEGNVEGAEAEAGEIAASAEPGTFTQTENGGEATSGRKAGAASDETSEAQNAKPSETSTERGTVTEEAEKRSEERATEGGERREEGEGERPQTNSEKEAKAAKNEQLENEMQTSSEKDPEEEAGRKDFGLIQGGRDRQQPQGENYGEDGEDDGESEEQLAA